MNFILKIYNTKVTAVVMAFLFVLLFSCDPLTVDSTQTLDGVWKLKTVPGSSSSESDTESDTETDYSSFTETINYQNVEMEEYWVFSGSKFYDIVKITNIDEISKSDLYELSELWYNKFGCYFNEEGIVYSKYSINSKDYKITVTSEETYYNNSLGYKTGLPINSSPYYYIDDLQTGKVLRVGSSSNAAYTFVQTEEDFSKSTDNFVPLQFTLLTVGSTTDVAFINDSSTTEKTAYMRAELKGGKQYNLYDSDIVVGNSSNITVYYHNSNSYNGTEENAFAFSYTLDDDLTNSFYSSQIKVYTDATYYFKYVYKNASDVDSLSITLTED